MDWLAKELGVDNGGRLNNVSIKTIKEKGGEKLLQYYGNSMSKLIAELYEPKAL